MGVGYQHYLCDEFKGLTTWELAINIICVMGLKDLLYGDWL